MHHGPLVKWLRQRPLTPLTSVRIRYGSPAVLKRQLTGSTGCANIKRLEAERLLTINDGGKRHPNELVLIAVRVHLFPSRTQKLSSHAPTILGGRLPGKIGNANIEKLHPFGWSFLYALTGMAHFLTPPHILTGPAVPRSGCFLSVLHHPSADAGRDHRGELINKSAKGCNRSLSRTASAVGEGTNPRHPLPCST